MSVFRNLLMAQGKSKIPPYAHFEILHGKRLDTTATNYVDDKDWFTIIRCELIDNSTPIDISFDFYKGDTYQNLIWELDINYQQVDYWPYSPCRINSALKTKYVEVSFRYAYKERAFIRDITNDKYLFKGDWIFPPTTEDYIQDGLAFHLDCRDAKPSVDGNNWQWVDRIGKIPFDMTSVLQQADKGLVFDGVKSGGLNKDNTPVLNIKSDVGTIEITFSKEITYPSLYYILFIGSEAGSFGMGRSSVGWIWSTSRKNTYQFNGYEKFSGTISVQKEKAIVLKKGIPKTKELENWNVKQYCAIGMRGNNENSFVGKIYSIRIYNRQLSEEEMLHNQQVDIDTYFGGVLPQ